MIRDISIKALLILSFLLTGLIPTMILSLVSLNSSKDQLQVEAFRQLESIRNIKKVQIKNYFNERLSDIIVLSENPYIKQTYKELASSFYSKKRNKNRMFSGFKHEKFKAPENYTQVHDKHFKVLKKITGQYRYYDFFFMDPVYGDTIFTVKKESDFGIRISKVDSSLKDVWLKAMKTGRPSLSDTKPYSPSANAPAQFLASPMKDGTEIFGVIAVQISIDFVGDIMRERSGMWRSGETYLVGPDKKMRSDSHNDRTFHSVLSSFRGTIEKNGVDTFASESALKGRTGKMIIMNYQNLEVLSAFAPINILGVKWAIIAEVDKKEIDRKISEVLNTKIILLFMTSLILVISMSLIISVFISRGINNTIHQIELLIKKVLNGDHKSRIDPDLVGTDFRGVVKSSNQLIAALKGERDEKKKLVEHLRSSRKLKTIGTLAAGIAHDFNNILSNMYSHCHIIKEETNPAGITLESFNNLDNSLEAASVLVRQILTFSSSSVLKRTEVNVAENIREVLIFLKGSIPGNIKIETDFPDRSISISVASSQLHQVFLNLIINACHSIGNKKGFIKISLGKNTPCPGISGKKDDFCEIKIEDSGSGMQPEILEKIFEPFFSTKSADEGSGLGLSIVHGIIMNSRGKINVESSPGKGSVFFLYFPLLRKQDKPEKLKKNESGNYKFINF